MRQPDELLPQGWTAGPDAPVFLIVDSDLGNKWELVGGAQLWNVHPFHQCSRWTFHRCPMHAPTDHHMRSWRQTFTAGRMSRRCEHGNYHLDPDSSLALSLQLLYITDDPDSCLCYLPPEHRTLTDEEIREQLRSQLRRLR